AAVATAEDDGGGAVSKKTIRLVPKASGGVDDDTQKTPKSASAPKPSAPTVKLKESDATQKTARPSAPTVKMPEPPADEESPASSKKTLKLRSAKTAEATSSVAGGEGMPPGEEPPAAGTPSLGRSAPAVSDKGADPGIVLTLVALFALVAVAYYVWMVGGQWAEQYMEAESANVPGLSGNVK
ncbi:MAG: hypothetical protein JW808_02905, partial [Victivallales bacterium]|nr:hypothetical protein [Victivallales bacterium]